MTAAGGTGLTYLAENRKTKELVAIKLIKRPIPKVLETNILREIVVSSQSAGGPSQAVQDTSAMISKSESSCANSCPWHLFQSQGQDQTLQCVLQIQANLGEGHVNIINAYEAILTETHLALVMEYAACGSLTSFVANRWQVAQHTGLFLSEDEARFFFRVSGSEESGLQIKCDPSSEDEARFILRGSNLKNPLYQEVLGTSYPFDSSF